MDNDNKYKYLIGKTVSFKGSYGVEWEDILIKNIKKLKTTLGSSRDLSGYTIYEINDRIWISENVLDALLNKEKFKEKFQELLNENQ